MPSFKYSLMRGVFRRFFNHEAIVAPIPAEKGPLAATGSKAPALRGREGAIDVRELIGTLSPDDLKASADAYFSSVKNVPLLLAKPFRSIEECPTLITHFAKILQCGAFVPGQSVLEFGAGSCWAGRLLNQLGLEVVSLDISPTALKYGEQLKNAWRVFGDQPDHRFLEFDGLHIDLPDGSIDRIVCFDCFHHVANPAHLLREFFRVLKPGGLVAFSEPGRFHSLERQSQEEMKNYRVIENDIVIEDIWAMGHEIGYSTIYFALAAVQPVLLDLAGFARFQQEGMTAETQKDFKRAVEQHHENVTIFFMVKGTTETIEESDSRVRSGLCASIRLLGRELLGEASGSRQLKLAFEIENLSGKTWLKSGKKLGNVNLGAHLFDRQGHMRDYDYFRHEFLPEDAAPGSRVAFTCLVPWPQEMDGFVLEFDLVSEFVSWFAMNGSEAVTLTWPGGQTER